MLASVGTCLRMQIVFVTHYRVKLQKIPPQTQTTRAQSEKSQEETEHNERVSKQTNKQGTNNTPRSTKMADTRIPDPITEIGSI